MCWRCDNPDEPEETYLRLVRSKIDEYGWFIQAVGADRYHPPFAYTVGLTDYGNAELLVNGLPRQAAHALLNNVAHDVLFHSGPLEPGDVVPSTDGPAIEVVEISEPTAHLFTAVNLYGPGIPIRAQQLVYADDRGQWPWQVGFRGRQRVLGPRSPQAA